MSASTAPDGPARGGLAAPLTEISLVVFCVLVAEWAILPLFGRNYSTAS